jgi:RNA polymerase sigma-70 factor, ECF subfamily
LLREVFDYGYEEIAAVVGKSPDNCRQIAVRARRQVQARKPRFEASRRKRQELSRRFFEAVEAEDTQGLVGLLAADVVVYGDGGGKAPASLHPVYGRERVVQLVGQFRPFSQRLGVRSIRYAEVNGQPGALYLDPRGTRWRWCLWMSPTTWSRPCAPSPTPTSFATSPTDPD